MLYHFKVYGKAVFVKKRGISIKTDSRIKSPTDKYLYGQQIFSIKQQGNSMGEG